MGSIGFKPGYRPGKSNQERASDVLDILDRYKAQKPLTLRQIFYIMVAQYSYAKTESEANTQQRLIGEMRRGGYIPFSDIRDDKFVSAMPLGYARAAEFYDSVRADAAGFRLDRQRKQAVYIEVWCEAAGMTTQLDKVCVRYGVPVYSGGGFTTITSKHNAGAWMAEKKVPTVVLHIGDHDWSGEVNYKNLVADVSAFAVGLGGPRPLFQSLAVTPAQITQMSLETTPEPSKNARLGRLRASNVVVQAEAIPPPDMAKIVRAGIESLMDMDLLDKTLNKEAKIRNQIIAEVADLGR